MEIRKIKGSIKVSIKRSIKGSFMGGAQAVCLLVMAGALVACGPKQPELTPAQQAAQALQQATTLEALEAVLAAHPGNADVLEALAFAYAKNGDTTLAAFYFKNLSQAAPEKAYLLPYAADAYVQAGETTAALEAYAQYAALYPADRSIARKQYALLLQQNNVAGALAAFERSIAAPETMQQLQERIRLNTALGRTAVVQELNKLVLQHASASVGQKHAAVNALLKAPLQAGAQSGNWEGFERALAALGPAKVFAKDAFAQGPNAQAYAAYQAFKNPPAIVAESEEAEPEPAGAASEAEGEGSAEAALAELGGAVEIAPIALDNATEEAPEVEPLTVEELLAAAAEKRASGNVRGALLDNWQAVKIGQGRADVWHELALSYLADGQGPNAETTAMEAMRLKPAEVQYALTYLRVVQQNHSPERLMRDLRRAQKNYPQSPDILLALARGVDRVENNSRDARFLYAELLALAPQHPERTEIENRLRQLR